MTEPERPDQRTGRRLAAPSPPGYDDERPAVPFRAGYPDERPAPLPAGPPAVPFRDEIRAAIRYERGLALKAGLALLLVAAVLVTHVLLFT